MITLGIETSGRAGSVALLVDGALASERELSASGRRHARTLVPEISAILKERSVRPEDVDLVAVSIGPGSFTGLRVGTVCAKTFAYATGCRLAAVDTFLAVAAAHEEADRIWVIDDALRGDIFAGEYVKKGNRWTESSRPRLISLVEWKRQILPEVLVSGAGVNKLAGDLSGLRLADADLQIPQARWIARLGEESRDQSPADPWTLEPVYIRRSAAEEKADAKAAAGGAVSP